MASQEQLEVIVALFNKAVEELRSGSRAELERVAEEVKRGSRAELERVVEEVKRGTRAELERAAAEVRSVVAEDALVWAVPFIQIVAGEYVRFLLGPHRQPQPPRSRTCFRATVFYDFLAIIQRDLRISFHAAKALCDRIVLARNLSAHGDDLTFKVFQCQRLFVKYPVLSSLLPDQHSLLTRVPELLCRLL